MRLAACIGCLLIPACAIEPLPEDAPREVTVQWALKGVGDVPVACPPGGMLEIDVGESERVPCEAAATRTFVLDDAVSAVAVSLTDANGGAIRTSTVRDLDPERANQTVEVAIYPEAAQLAAGWGFVSTRTGRSVSCAVAGIDAVELHYALHEIDAEVQTARFACDDEVGIPPALPLGVYVGQLHALHGGVEVAKSKGMFFVLDEYNTVGFSDDIAIPVE